MNLLEMEGVRKEFGGVVALSDVTLQVRAGTIKALIGPNGAGKTTTFNVISGVFRPDAGWIRFKGEPIHHLPPDAIARRGMARAFQNLSLFQGMTVVENVMVGFDVGLQHRFLLAGLPLPWNRRRETSHRAQARAILERVGLGAHADRLVGALSYGQRKRLEVARALATGAELLLLDEPAAGLTAEEIGEYADMLAGLRRDGKTLLIIDHNMDLIMGICDEITVLNFGQVLAEGRPEQVAANPQVIAAYLGDELPGSKAAAAGGAA